MCVRVSVSVISQARLEGVQDTEQYLAAGKSCAAPRAQGTSLVILQCLQPEKGLRALTSLVSTVRAET